MKTRLSRFSLLLLAGLGLYLPTDALAKGSKGGNMSASTPDVIAAAIAQDSGRPEAAYRGYAVRLTQTLNGLSTRVLDRVLGEHASVVTSGDGSIDGGTTTPPNDPAGGGTTTPPPDGSSTPPGSASTPPNDPAVDGPLIDQLNDASLGHSEVRDSLIQASPLSSAVLSAAILPDANLDSSDRKDVLLANIPLPSEVYAEVAAGNAGMSTSDTVQVMAAQAAAATSAP